MNSSQITNKIHRIIKLSLQQVCMQHYNEQILLNSLLFTTLVVPISFLWVNIKKKWRQSSKGKWTTDTRKIVKTIPVSLITVSLILQAKKFQLFHLCKGNTDQNVEAIITCNQTQHIISCLWEQLCTRSIIYWSGIWNMNFLIRYAQSDKWATQKIRFQEHPSPNSKE